MTAFAYKIYWRPIGQVWHAFWKYNGPAGRRWYSLCTDSHGPRWNLSRSGGQSVARPPPLLRCPLCDGREMDIRHFDQSLPELPEWTSFHWPG